MGKCTQCKINKLNIVDEAMKCSECKLITCSKCRNIEHNCPEKQKTNLKQLYASLEKVQEVKIDKI